MTIQRPLHSNALFRSKWLHWPAAMLCALPLLSGCESLHLPLMPSKPVDWQMQVIPADRPGQYQLSGQANLPDRTPLTVIALRYLHPSRSANAATQNLRAAPTYSILDYSPIQIVNGQWQTQLNLWQVETDGRYQEAWQLEQRRLNLTFQPDSEVIFLATVAPSNTLPKLEQLLRKKQLQFPAQSLRITPEGERFAQLFRTIEVDLPTGKTTPATPPLDDQNDGWGERYIIPKEPQNPTQLIRPDHRQTNAPPRTAEFLR